MTTLTQAVRDAIEALKTPTPREIIAERLERALEAEPYGLMAYRDTVRSIGAAREKHLAELREALDGAKEYVERAIASFVGDPADNRFLKGYLAALEVVRNEAFSTEAK